MVRILGVGIPFRDRFALTTEADLKSRNLEIGKTKIDSKEFVEQCWGTAKQLSSMSSVEAAPMF